MNESVASPSGNAPHYVAFIDILYAVVVGYGFEQFVQHTDLPMELGALWSETGFFFAFALGIATRDWVTYHRLIEKRPHVGAPRFLLDLLILFSFFLMVAVATDGHFDQEHVQAFAGYATCYFFLIVAWQAVEISNYPDNREVRTETVWDLAYFTLFSAWLLLARLQPTWAANVAFSACVAIVFTLVSWLHWRWNAARDTDRLTTSEGRGSTGR